MSLNPHVLSTAPASPQQSDSPRQEHELEPSLSTTDVFPILKLPPELRRMVYEHTTLPSKIEYEIVSNDWSRKITWNNSAGRISQAYAALREFAFNASHSTSSDDEGDDQSAILYRKLSSLKSLKEFDSWWLSGEDSSALSKEETADHVSYLLYEQHRYDILLLLSQLLITARTFRRPVRVMRAHNAHFPDGPRTDKEWDAYENVEELIEHWESIKWPNYSGPNLLMANKEIRKEYLDFVSATTNVTISSDSFYHCGRKHLFWEKELHMNSTRTCRITVNNHTTTPKTSLKQLVCLLKRMSQVRHLRLSLDNKSLEKDTTKEKVLADEVIACLPLLQQIEIQLVRDDTITYNIRENSKGQRVATESQREGSVPDYDDLYN